jgi:hypothetical protein
MRYIFRKKILLFTQKRIDEKSTGFWGDKIKMWVHFNLKTIKNQCFNLIKNYLNKVTFPCL